MGKIYGKNQWGKFMGKIYRENLWGKLTRKINVENLWGKSMVLFNDPFHLPLTGIFNGTLYNKLIVQSMIKNPHKNQTMIFNIFYRNFYGLGI